MSLLKAFCKDYLIKNFMKSFYTTTYLPLYTRNDLDFLYEEKPKKNEIGLLLGVAMILYPGSRVDVLRNSIDPLVEVKTPHYKFDIPLYVDCRYLTDKQIRNFSLPSFDKALENLSLIKEDTRYIWGGNHSEGIPRLLEDFPPKVELNQEEKKDWILQGLDCSGLFFQVCEGASPRNCSIMHQIGEEIVGAGLHELRPLDLILTPDHVVVVESTSSVIESTKRFNGVRRSPLTKEFLELEIFKKHRIIRPFFKNIPVPCYFFS
jgi:hypothetical protein